MACDKSLRVNQLKLTSHSFLSLNFFLVFLLKRFNYNEKVLSATDTANKLFSRNFFLKVICPTNCSEMSFLCGFRRIYPIVANFIYRFTIKKFLHFHETLQHYDQCSLCSSNWGSYITNNIFLSIWVPNK